MEKEYNFKEIEKIAREKWERLSLYKTPENPRKKFYLLEMFLYPSGDIHMGHCRNYVIGDLIYRYKRMNGYDILHPFGWDAFGLPAEQAAIKRGASPKKWVYNNINTSKNTLKLLNISYDWDREVLTAEPSYYKWNQWIFLRLYEKGLAYRKKSYVNWCPSCKTVLANEQVIGGRCWRCDSIIIKKEMEQWYFKITEYAERLLQGIERLKDWPENIKTMQKNWIGKSIGTEIEFDTIDGETLKVFTTRADTLFGVTFISVAPEHPFANGIDKKEVKEYIDKALLMTEIDRQSQEREKTGVFSGVYAIHPLTGEKVPVFVADYVLSSYGTGVVMGVPAHDQRDFEFAKKYNLPIKVVISPDGKDYAPDILDKAYEEYGILVNSFEFNGMDSKTAIDRINDKLERLNKGRKKITYKLRDWLVSRQRYWGTPIPMIHCPECGIVPVPENELPVVLPPEDKVNFIPQGRSPLEDCSEFYNVKCPKCGGDAHRDPDTMDTFVDSSWYHLRYFDPKNDKEIFKRGEADKWFPIDLYIGGAEHATGHLIYFRFITKFLYDLGYLKDDEPAIRLFNQGMVCDEKGQVMSKSKGNTVSPIDMMNKIGLDATRIAVIFAAPPEKDILWSTKDLAGSERFLKRIYNHFTPYISRKNPLPDKDDILYKKIERTKKFITEHIENFLFNTAVAGLMEMLNDITAYEDKGNDTYAYVIQEFTKILAPFAPHISEYLYSFFGKKESIFFEEWPKYDEDALFDEVVTVIIQVNGKLRGKVEAKKGSDEKDIFDKAIKDENIRKFIDGKDVLKKIYIQDKILNIVVK